MSKLRQQQLSSKSNISNRAMIVALRRENRGFVCAPLYSCLLLFILGAGLVKAQSNAYEISDLPRCTLTSLELTQLGPDDPLEPCILYDEGEDTSSTVTMVQVTPSSCHVHRDGVVTGVRKLNDDNEGQGVFIGYSANYTVGGDEETPLVGRRSSMLSHISLL